MHWPAFKLDNRERSDNSHGEPLPTSYDDPEYRKGWTDGRVGAKSANQRKILELVAARRRDALVVELQQKLEIASAEHATLQDRASRARGDTGPIETAFNETEQHRIENPSHYSWPLGLVYCFVALILWIADLPLSLLAADGLDIRTNYSVLSDLSLIRANWTTLWEPLAFAIGIAALGLFFKFVADFFFKPRFRSHPAFKFVSIALVICVTALVTWNLYYLAQLRAGVKSLHEAQRRAALSSTAPTDVDALNQQMQRGASISFVLLTLTLPIIGGICASAGWSRLQNAWSRGALARVRRRVRKALDDAVWYEQDAAATVRSRAAELEAVRTASIAPTVDAALGLYEDGFMRGFLVPETIHNGRRFHERVEFAIGRWLAIAQRRVVENDRSRTEAAE
ncbi:MAG TPA: hypothetical protein VNN08_10835 [Thermoanaerobaculia bacterium]|nr:hypothetical protein [Thermoanaerobaculia bacterium]